MKEMGKMGKIAAWGLCLALAGCGSQPSMPMTPAVESVVQTAEAKEAAATAATEAAESAVVSSPQKITAQEAKAMMDAGDVVVVDVREESEFAEGHIPGALLLPQGEIEAKAGELLPDMDQAILLYCRSGRRSALAAQALADMGYTRVYDFGGIKDWPYEVEN